MSLEKFNFFEGAQNEAEKETAHKREQFHEAFDGKVDQMEAHARLINAARSGDMGAIEKLADGEVGKRVAEKQGITDQLTSLFNRRNFDAMLPIRIEESVRYGKNCSLLMIDLDHFKQVNDRFGHLKGDEILQRAARVIAKVKRESDLAFRYGGEEFAVFLPEADVAQAQIVAERIRQAVQREFAGEENEALRKTTSIGLAAISQLETQNKNSEQLKTELIGRADDALYQAKNSGRNQVAVFEENEQSAAEVA